MNDKVTNTPTIHNKQPAPDHLQELYRRYDGPIPKDTRLQVTMPRDAEAKKWLRFWRGQVLHAVYALRRQRAQRYAQRTRQQFRQWRGGVITRRKTLTGALRTYRQLQQQKTQIKNRPPE